MKKTAYFLIAAFFVAAVVMYMYWQKDTQVIEKGVMVWSEKHV